MKNSLATKIACLLRKGLFERSESLAVFTDGERHYSQLLLEAE